MEKQNVKVLSRAEMKKLKGGSVDIDCINRCVTDLASVNIENKEIYCENLCRLNQTT